MGIYFLIWILKDEKGDQWQEEVQLSDGSIVVVERTIQGKPNRELGYGDFRAEAQTVQILNTALPVWMEKWSPVLLDKNQTGAWFLIVTPTYCYNWNSEFPYRQYEVINGRWQQVEFDMSLKGRPANLIWNYYVGEMPDFIKLSEKPFRGSDSRQSARRYREIYTDYRLKSC